MGFLLLSLRDWSKADGVHIIIHHVDFDYLLGLFLKSNLYLFLMAVQLGT